MKKRFQRFNPKHQIIRVLSLIFLCSACDDQNLDTQQVNAGEALKPPEEVGGEYSAGNFAGNFAGQTSGESSGGVSNMIEGGETLLGGNIGGTENLMGGESASIDLNRGSQLYQQYCGFCHGIEGEGYLADNANALSNQEFLSVATDTFLSQAIIHGRPGTPMSPWGTLKGGPLDQSMVNDIVAFIGTWRETILIDHPAPELEGNPQRGTPLYQAVCANCHGIEGEGISAVSLNNPWFLNTASDGMIAHAIQIGRSGTDMAAYGPPLVNTQGLADLVALIRSWQQPVDTTPPPPFTPQVDQAPLNPNGPEPNFELREGRFVSALDVYEAMEMGARFTLIDARPAADYLDEHIMGAISLPFYDIDQYVNQLPQDSFTITYCGCPHAVSGQAADALIEYGFNRVAILDEGFYEWRDTFEYPTTNGTSPQGN